MGHMLIIAEKPSVASSIAMTLQAVKKDGYFEADNLFISYAYGHLFKLADTRFYNEAMTSWQLKDYPFIPEKFKYLPIDDNGVKKQIKILNELAAKADLIVNACDSDREGEVIFLEIADSLKFGKPIKRLWLSSHTPRDIEKGMNNLKDRMTGLEKAGYCRQRMDWLMGINFSVVFTLLAGGELTLKLGRVLLPTLNLIFLRDAEIASFRASKFYTLKSSFAAGNDVYTGTYIIDGNTRFDSLEQLQVIQKSVLNQPGVIIKKEVKELSFGAPRLFNLTDIQGYITSKYDGFSAETVLSLMQQLYEKKFLSYPRTASRYLDESQIKDAEDSLNAVIGLPGLDIKDRAAVMFHTEKRVFDTSKVDSHPAIMPTYIVPDIRELTQEERIVYMEVVKRFVAQFMPPAVYDCLEMITKVGEHEFITKGKVLKSEGWKQLFSHKEDSGLLEGEDQELDAEDTIKASSLRTGLIVNTAGAELKEGVTQAPKHYTEKTLLSAMENCGKKVSSDEDVLKGFTIGTPATRSETIKKLIDTGYVMKKGKYLLITELGAKVIYYFPVKKLLEVNFTGRIEKTLKDIENGQYDAKEFMNKMSSFTVKTVEDMKVCQIPVIRKSQNVLGKCPDCGRFNIVETEKAYSCEGTKTKECKFTLWKDDKFLNTFGKKMTESIAKNLIEKQQVLVKGLKSKKNESTKFDAIICLRKNPESGYWNYELKFPNKGSKGQKNGRSTRKTAKFKRNSE